MCEADWPGNVRELRNVVERCVILADGPILSWDGGNGNEVSSDLPVSFSREEFLPLEQLEQEYINHVLKCLDGKKTKAAKVLGIDKTTLWRKLRRYDGADQAV